MPERSSILAIMFIAYHAHASASSAWALDKEPALLPNKACSSGEQVT
jgi:hypothetical protein